MVSVREAVGIQMKRLSRGMNGVPVPVNVKREITNRGRIVGRCIAVRRPFLLVLQCPSRWQSVEFKLRNSRPGSTERVTDNQQLVGAGNGLIISFAERTSTRVMYVHKWTGEFFLRPYRVSCTAPLEPAAPQRRKLREWRLMCGFQQNATGAGEMFTDRSGQNAAARLAPFEEGGSRTEPDHVASVLRNNSLQELTPYLLCLQRLDRGPVEVLTEFLIADLN